MTKRIILGAVAILLVIAAAYAAFFIAPQERTMGLIQRIFYFHAATAWAGEMTFFVCFLSNLLYVWKRQPKYDWLGVSSAEVGLACITVVLITGPVWAHPVWGIWWTWDARLTSTFVLWVIYVSYLLLRTLVGDPERRAMVSAVFGIFAFLDVPLVYLSIWFWRTQHPQPVIGGGGLDKRMWPVFLICWAALLALMALLVRQRYRLEALRHEVSELAINVEVRSAERATEVR